MIDIKTFLSGIDARVGIWSGATDGAELARMVEFATENKVDMLSVLPDAIDVVWPWIEKQHIGMLGRFYVNDDKIDEVVMSDLTARINMSFKHGANGAIVFVRYKNMKSMIDQVAVIRDDLFFNRELIIGVDIGDIDSNQWGDLFENLRRINASAVMFALTKDMGKKSDFVGRVYGMLNAWDAEFNGALHFALGNSTERIDQAQRLVASMRPDLMSGLRIWVNY